MKKKILIAMLVSLIAVVICLVVFKINYESSNTNETTNDGNVNNTSDTNNSDNIKSVVSSGYSLSGYLYDKDGKIIEEADLVVYSETPKYVKTDNKGYFYVDGLEKGNHDIYYIDESNIKDLTKDDIINKSKVKIEISTDNNEVKYSNDEYKIKIEINNNTINNTYNIKLDTKGGSLDSTTYEVTKNNVYGCLPIPIKEGCVFDGWYYGDEEILNNTYVKLDQTHTLTAKYSLNILISSYEGVYDGKEHTIDIKTSLKNAEITYSKDGKTYSENKVYYTDAGEYKVYYKVKFGDDEETGTASVNITKKENTLKLNYDKGITVYPNNVTIKVEENASGGKLSVGSTNELKAIASITNNVITIKPLNTGTVIIKVKSEETQYYNQKVVTYELTINSGTIEVTHSGYDAEYDGNEHGITIQTNIEDAKITYSTDNIKFRNTNPQYKNAGEYTIYYKVSKKGYETVTGNETVKIAKSTSSLIIDKTSGTLTYPEIDVITVNSNAFLEVSSSCGYAAVASVKENKVIVKTSSEPGQCDGISIITITSKENENYKSSTATYTANVVPGTIKLTKVNYNGTYDGNEHTGTVNLETEDVDIIYRTEDGEYESNTLPKFTETGVYTIYYEANKKGYDTLEGSLTVTISKANNVLTLSQTEGETYYQNVKTFDVTGNISNGTLSVEIDDDTLATVSVNNQTISMIGKLKEGTTQVKVTSAETDNYESATVTYDLKVVYPSYTVTFNKTNTTTSSETLTVKYGSSNTITITPDTDYYISSVSCTNGYTTNATTGEENDTEQTITISNNNNLQGSICTVTSTVKPYISLYNIVKGLAKNDTINFSIRSGADSVIKGIYKTSETGGVKLIYNGTLTNGERTATGNSIAIGEYEFNEYYSDNAYVGYMYGTAVNCAYAATHSNINNSTIKHI